MAAPSTCSGNTIFLYDTDNVPNQEAVEDFEEHVHEDGIVKVSKVTRPSIEVFLPSPKIATGDAIVICPGGGYWLLAYDLEGTDIASYWVSQGVAAIVLKNRLPGSPGQRIRHKSPLLDVQRAIRTVRYNAGLWGINPKRIGIQGFSAGGHLATSASTLFDSGSAASDDPIERESSRPDFSILVYPVISFQESFGHSGSRSQLLGDSPDEKLLNRFSGELQVTENTPPAILIHSADDEGVSYLNSVSYFNALQSAGVSGELHVYPNGGHGYGLAVGQGYLSEWPTRCRDWLANLG
ncbi:alpha/beta hydrolase [Pelagicoccus mobilis]|uniref:Alpha/beta hydrolase n=1 Tax=Pelagicoccus mobilis TaxID=415221 RepID=A0A934RYL5_9BACT|nr:alpha/beta hydrolase [Pelagicoccus mobilis]MBK1878743.1 alpha/beta hydrolase [Pelagicoccus mobilis]